MKPTQSKPGIVFCHGLWADGSCFSKVIGPLQAEGYECIAAQYGLNSTAEDVALVKATIGRVTGPVILVGHSYGGSVITGRNRRSRCRPGVHLCARSGRRRDISDTAIQVPEDGRLLPHRSRGWTNLAASRRHEVFLRRSFGAGAEAGLGDSGRASSRPVQRESRGNRLEVEAKLVHRRQERPDRASRSGALLREAHGSNHDGGRQQPRSHAFSPRRGDRCNPRCGKCSSKSHGSSVKSSESASMG
jgi:pimeloyl-ACP methyl ester carboxylesterase